MLTNSFFSMVLLSTKMLITKYCCRILSSITFIKLIFIAEFMCATFIIFLSLTGMIDVPMSAYVDGLTLRTGVPASVLIMLSEVFIALALNEGPTGPVSAIISFNAVLVSILVWLITGIALTFY